MLMIYEELWVSAAEVIGLQRQCWDWPRSDRFPSRSPGSKHRKHFLGLSLSDGWDPLSRKSLSMSLWKEAGRIQEVLQKNAGMGGDILLFSLLLRPACPQPSACSYLKITGFQFFQRSLGGVRRQEPTHPRWLPFGSWFSRKVPKPILHLCPEYISLPIKVPFLWQTTQPHIPALRLSAKDSRLENTK